MPRFSATTSPELPLGPPPEVLQQLDVAWERARELFDSDLELHFEVDAGLGRVWAELRLADGTVTRGAGVAGKPCRPVTLGGGAMAVLKVSVSYPVTKRVRAALRDRPPLHARKSG